MSLIYDAHMEHLERHGGCFDEPLPTKPCPDCNGDPEKVDDCKTCEGLGEVEIDPSELEETIDTGEAYDAVQESRRRQ